MRTISPARTSGCRIVVSLRDQLKGVAVATGDDHCAAMPLFLSHRSGEEVVRLVARRLRIGKAALRNELRQHVELVHQLGVEDAAALVSRERPVAISRGVEGVPADQHRTGLLRA